MTGSFLLSASCSVFPIIKLTSTWSCLYNNSRPWATPEQPLVEDTRHTCTALSFVTLITIWVWVTSMEDRHSVKLSRLLVFDCAGIEQLSVPQRNSRVSLGEPICIVCWHFLQPRASAHSALSGSSWADTPSYRNVLYPRGAVQLLETMAIALDRRLVRLCRHLSKNMNCEAER